MKEKKKLKKKMKKKKATRDLETHKKSRLTKRAQKVLINERCGRPMTRLQPARIKDRIDPIGAKVKDQLVGGNAPLYTNKKAVNTA